MKMFTNPQNKVKEENSNCIQLQEKKKTKNNSAISAKGHIEYEFSCYACPLKKQCLQNNNTAITGLCETTPLARGVGKQLPRMRGLLTIEPWEI